MGFFKTASQPCVIDRSQGWADFCRLKDYLLGLANVCDNAGRIRKFNFALKVDIFTFLSTTQVRVFAPQVSLFSLVETETIEHMPRALVKPLIEACHEAFTLRISLQLIEDRPKRDVLRFRSIGPCQDQEICPTVALPAAVELPTVTHGFVRQRQLNLELVS